MKIELDTERIEIFLRSVEDTWNKFTKWRAQGWAYVGKLIATPFVFAAYAVISIVGLAVWITGEIINGLRN